jgi:hypothetical protein
MARGHRPTRLAVKVPCHGEAHSNVHIDNCTVCAPHWGHFYCCPSCTATLDHKGICRNQECLHVEERFLFREDDVRIRR